MKKTLNKLTYQKSGVNIKNADKLIGNIKKSNNLKNSKVLAGIGGFSSLFSLDIKKYPNPVIVCGTDGVGTKLKIAGLLNEHRYIGQDLLAMCVNDVITCGATPLFFLDYLATSKIDIKLHTQILRGIQNACKSINIPLIGGETAEMPGMYKGKEYDLAGFCVGVVNKKDIIDKKRVKSDDVIIGINSNGFHSNGFSLINKLIQRKSISLRKEYSGINLAKALIRPTKIYADLLCVLKTRVNIHGAAHITGGGLTENLPRIIPDKFSIEIDLNSWKIPKVFRLIQDKAMLTDSDILKTFNCGIGMSLIVNKKDVKDVVMISKKLKYKPSIIGFVINKKNNKTISYEQS